MWIIFDVNGVITPNIEISIMNDYSKLKKKNRIITFLKYVYLLLDYQKGLLDDKYFWTFVLDKDGYNYVKKRYSKNNFLDKKIIKEIQKLRENNLKIAILSNSSHLMSAEYKKLKFYKLADKVFLSNELHMIKPEPRIYKYVMKELNAKPSECMLIDDSWYNIVSSKLMVWKVVWFHGVNDLSKILRKINKESYFQKIIKKKKEFSKKIKKIKKKIKKKKIKP